MVKGVRAVSDRITVKPSGRSDADVARDVKDALGFSTATDRLKLGVSVKGGIVTLTGTVPSHEERLMAERTVEGVRGVKAVTDELALAAPAHRADQAIQADVQNRFRWDRLLNDGLLFTSVHDGNVTLTGVVGSAAERRRAEREAWMNGVKSVDASGVKVEWWAKEDDLLRTKLAKRTDVEIARAIRDATAIDPRVESAGIEVDVSMGIANLRGKVQSLAAKQAAESLARNTVGVMDVHDELTIEPHAPVADKTITLHVLGALSYEPSLGTFKLDAKSHDGVVTLTGQVDSFFERAEAGEVAAGIRGVRRVDNQLTVKRPEVAYVYSVYLDPYEPFIESWHYAPAKPLLPDADIARQIKYELAFSPFIDENRVTVRVDRGTATLTGAVESYGEKAEAAEDAFEGGAIAVENRLQVSPPGG
jgi:osmotically-inducible protein OsmY